MTLILSALEKAIAQLEEAVQFATSDLAQSNPRLAPHLRAAAIQAFEFTYEMSHKLLRRALAASDPNPAAIADLDFSGLIRAGYARSLLAQDLTVWREFRHDRAATSHAYNNDTAQAVFDNIPRFLAEAKYLLRALQAQPPEAP